MVGVSRDEFVCLGECFRKLFGVWVASVAVKAKARCPEFFDLLPLRAVAAFGGFERTAHAGEFDPAVRA